MEPKFKSIFSCVTGSHLYGTATPTSDRDVRGVFIAPEEYYLGFLYNVEQVESHDPDEIHWEITKFFKLCIDNNPNIIELLFVPESYTLESSPIWGSVIEKRHMFLSTKARHTFAGYATSQLHRIKGHRNWLLNPPKKKPDRSDFGLPEHSTVDKEQLNAIDEIRSRIDVTEELLDVLQRERSYLNAMREWHQYQNWKKNRNPDRSELEERYGYDTKHASHLFRLLSEGKELLTTGYITFPRPDADELVAIRRGKYSYEELMDKIADIDAYFRSFENQIILPKNPKRKELDSLCRDLIKRELGYRR